MDVPVSEPTSSPVPPPAPVPGQPAMPQASAPPAMPRRTSGRWLDVILAVAMLVAVAGVAFAVGRATAPVGPNRSGLPNAGSGGPFSAGNRPNGAGGLGGVGGVGLAGRLGGLQLRGTVSTVSAGTITIQLANGATVTFGTDGTTTYHQQVAGSSTDVANGKQVLVQLGSVNRGNVAPGAQGSGPIGTASDVTVMTP